MTETKYYEVRDFNFEFTPHGDPYQGILVVRTPELEPYTSEINLLKPRTCTGYANRASKLCGMDDEALQAALNSICSKRHEEVAAAKDAKQEPTQECPEDDVPEEEIEMRIGEPGVLNRLVEDMGTFSRVVREREMLKLLSLSISSLSALTYLLSWS